jgi:putative transposase
MSETYQSLSHSRWDCTYHVVFIPKCRRKILYGEIRKPTFRTPLVEVAYFTACLAN